LPSFLLDEMNNEEYNEAAEFAYKHANGLEEWMVKLH
jgi:hypothetical protein